MNMVPWLTLAVRCKIRSSIFTLCRGGSTSMLHNEESHYSSHNLTKPNKRWKAQEVWPIKIFHTVEGGFKAGRTSYIQVQIISKGQSGLGGQIRKRGYGSPDSA